MKRLGAFLLAKEANAIVIAFLCALLPVFNIPTGFFAAIIVGFITLQKGSKSGLFLLAWVALPAIALLILRKVGQFDVLFLRCVVMWILASVLNRYRAWYFLLAIAVCMGVVFSLLLNHFVPNLQQWWVTQLTLSIKQYIAQTHSKIGMTPAAFAHKMAPMATAIALFVFFSSVLFELMISRLWQKSLFKK